MMSDILKCKDDFIVSKMIIYLIIYSMESFRYIHLLEPLSILNVFVWSEMKTWLDSSSFFMLGDNTDTEGVLQMYKNRSCNFEWW